MALFGIDFALLTYYYQLKYAYLVGTCFIINDNFILGSAKFTSLLLLPE